MHCTVRAKPLFFSVVFCGPDVCRRINSDMYFDTIPYFEWYPGKRCVEVVPFRPLREIVVWLGLGVGVYICRTLD